MAARSGQSAAICAYFSRPIKFENFSSESEISGSVWNKLNLWGGGEISYLGLQLSILVGADPIPILIEMVNAFF